MEMGMPALYLELNKACKIKDHSQLWQLGPFAYAFEIVVENAEANRMPKDKILSLDDVAQNQQSLPGELDFHDRYGEFDRLFILFRGAQMKQQWIEPYRKVIGLQKIDIPGYTSCTEDMSLALESAFTDLQEYHKPVLFLISIKNNKHYNGIRLNSEAYTPYPAEREVIFGDMMAVKVMAVHGIMITN